MVGSLAPEIAQLKNDLTADDWTVQTIVAARRHSLSDVTAVADTKALIKAAYDADPANVKQVYILGHVPVPYAGNSAWDGHTNHNGAWSADGYYGDMDGTWTDSSVNNSVAANVRLTNIPGDGRLDQSTIPSTLELMVGRVDLVNMQRAPASNVTETALLRRYLRKAHDFKYKQGAYANVQRRVLIRDGFDAFSGEPFMRTGWAWGFTAVGRPPEVTFDEAPTNNWWAPAAANTYLMANGNGGGSYELASGVGATADFGRRPFKAAFVSLFGSYFGDWDVANNFMRAPLAGNATGDGLGLTCFWAGRPTFFMHHMATGETVGYSMRVSMNSQFSSFSNPVYSPINFAGGGSHCGLLGDPSLRMHIVEPPRNLVATSASSQVNLAWSASTETALLGYHVFRADTPAGPFTRLTTTPLASPTYTDTTGVAAQSYTYLVRTLKLESSPGGTCQNLSQGEMATITVNAAATGAPLNPSNLAGGAIERGQRAVDVDRQRYGRDRLSPRAQSEWLWHLQHAGHARRGCDRPHRPRPLHEWQCLLLPSHRHRFGRRFAGQQRGVFRRHGGLLRIQRDLHQRSAKNVGIEIIAVKRFGGVNGPVSVSVATSNSTAIADTHYTTTTNTLNWADGETGEKTANVPIAATPTAQQPRQFRITLSSPSGGTGIGTYNAISVLIEDPTAPLPGPWNQAIIGTVTGSSPAVQAESSFSSATIDGTGLGGTGGSEAGQFIYQTRTGDGVMTALVPAASPAQSGARYAMMVRENSTNAGALMAGTVTTSSSTVGAKLHRLGFQPRHRCRQCAEPREHHRSGCIDQPDQRQHGHERSC